MPDWAIPADITDTHLLHDPFERQDFDARALDAVVTISPGVLVDDGKVLWVLRPMRGQHALNVPAVPSQVDEDAVFGMDQEAMLNSGQFDWERYGFSAGGQARVVHLL